LILHVNHEKLITTKKEENSRWINKAKKAKKLHLDKLSILEFHEKK